MSEKITLEQVKDNENFENEFNIITINNDRPITITKKERNSIEGNPVYTNAEKERKKWICLCNYY